MSLDVILINLLIDYKIYVGVKTKKRGQNKKGANFFRWNDKKKNNYKTPFFN